MTLIFGILWAFIWNLLGATLGLIPLGLIFLTEVAFKKICSAIGHYWKWRPLND